MRSGPSGMILRRCVRGFGFPGARFSGVGRRDGDVLAQGSWFGGGVVGGGAWGLGRAEGGVVLAEVRGRRRFGRGPEERRVRIAGSGSVVSSRTVRGDERSGAPRGGERDRGRDRLWTEIVTRGQGCGRGDRRKAGRIGRVRSAEEEAAVWRPTAVGYRPRPRRSYVVNPTGGGPRRPAGSRGRSRGRCSV